MGVVLCATRSPFNARCNSESMRGTMNRFGKGTLDLFKAGRKSGCEMGKVLRNIKDSYSVITLKTH